MIDRDDRDESGISVEAELATWGEDRVYFDPVWGNHGDHLIVMGSEVALGAAGVRRVADMRAADRIVIKGGGYRAGGGWLSHIARLIADADEVPVMILPSTFEDPTGILSLLRHRRGSSTIYFRERFSYELAQDSELATAVDLRCDHDMAFRLKGSRYLQEMHDLARPSTLLIVERTDGESVSGRRAGSLGPAWLKARIPESLKLTAKRKMRQVSARHWGSGTDFASASVQFLHTRRPDYVALPLITGDISRIDFCTFDQFGAYVANAAVVVTTRLHVGILAALLGKETHLVPGVYHKMMAVYSYSLTNMPGVHLLDLDSFKS